MGNGLVAKENHGDMLSALPMQGALLRSLLAVCKNTQHQALIITIISGEKQAMITPDNQR